VKALARAYVCRAKAAAPEPRGGVPITEAIVAHQSGDGPERRRGDGSGPLARARPVTRIRRRLACYGGQEASADENG